MTITNESLHCRPIVYLQGSWTKLTKIPLTVRRLGVTIASDLAESLQKEKLHEIHHVSYLQCQSLIVDRLFYLFRYCFLDGRQAIAMEI